MKEEMQKSPVSFAILITLIITFIYAVVQSFALAGMDTRQRLYGDSLLRTLFTAPCIYLMWLAARGRGLKLAFGLKGFGRGMMAGAPMLLLAACHAGTLLFIKSVNTEYIPLVVPVVLQQLATGLFEEGLWRGVLVTIMLIKLGGTRAGRAKAALISGGMFGMLHLTNLSLGLGRGLLSMLFAAIVGVLLSAVYMYSQNLLSCMALHALYDIAVHMRSLIGEYRGGALFFIAFELVPIVFVIFMGTTAFALLKKSEEFTVAEQ